MSDVGERAELGLIDPRTGVPYDSFAARLAVVRIAMGGLNVKAAALACGIEPESWRRWEHKADSRPRDMVGVCTTIADRAGIDRDWLLFGGALTPRSRCLTTLPPILGQIELPWDVIVPTLIEHSTPTSPLPTGMREEIEEGGPCTTSRSTRSTNYVAVSLDPRSTRAATN